MTVKLKAHNWKYTVDNKDTITAECADCGADGGSVTLTAPAAGTLTYDITIPGIGVIVVQRAAKLVAAHKAGVLHVATR